MAHDTLTITPGNTEITVSWPRHRMNSGDFATYYRLFRSTTSGINWDGHEEDSIYRVDYDGSPSFSYTDTGLTNGTTYYYVVGAYRGGADDFSNEGAGAPSADVDVPDQVTGVTPVQNGLDIRITWNEPDANPAVTHYEIWRQFNSVWTQLEDDVSGTTYTEDAAAIAQAGNNPYYYGIRAHNEEGAGDWSAYPSIDLELNDIRPHNISVTGDTDSRTITWDKPDGYTPSRYGITRGSTSLSTSHTSTSYTDNTDLSPGTYTYVIGGYDASGDYAEATGVSIVVSDTVTAPGVPTSVSAVAASTTSITFTWSAPTSGGAPTSYEVQYKASSSGTWLASSDDTSPVTFTSLSQQSYDFRVRARNSGGDSNWVTDTASPTTLSNVPPAPTNVSVVQSGFDIDISWDSVSSTPAVTSYSVKYRNGSSGTLVTLVDNLSSSSVSYTHNDASEVLAVNNYTRHYEVTATNSVGTSAAGTDSISLDPDDVRAHNIQVTGDNNSRTITWDAPEGDGFTGTVTYSVRRGSYQVESSTTSRSATDSVYLSDGTYSYILLTFHSTGQVVSPAVPFVIDATLEAPGTPTSVSATAQGDGISVSWSAPTSGGDPSSYQVQYKRSSDSAWSDASDITSPSIIAGLVANTLYNVRVRARNSAGDSNWVSTNVTTANVSTTAPGVPVSVSATATGPTEIQVSWSPPTSGGEVDTYEIRWRQGTSGSYTTINNIGSTFNIRTIGNLSPSTSYQAQVRARNSAGTSSWTPSGHVSATTTDEEAERELPSAVRRLQADSTTSGVVLDWLEPTSSGTGGAINGYNIWRHDGNAWGQLVINTGNTSVTYTDASNDLVSGKRYWYAVRARNPSGSGEWSQVIDIVIAPDLPSNPRQFTADSQSTGVVMSWIAPEYEGTAAISGYEIWRKSATGTWARRATTGVTLSYTDTSTLTYGDTYHYLVRAVNSKGTGERSQSVAVVINPDRPSAPRRLAASINSSGHIVLSWTAPTDNGGRSITGYQIWRYNGSSWSTVDTVGNVLTYTDDDNLSDDITYSYAIRATNSNGAGEWSQAVQIQAMVDSSILTAPQQFTVVWRSSGVVMEWEAPAHNGGSSVTGYQIYRYDGNSWSLVVLLGNVTTYTDTSSLTQNQTYYYTVRARNSDGFGEWAGSVGVIADPTVPSEPRRFSADAQSLGVVMSWSAPIYDRGSAVTGYEVWRSDGITWGKIADVGTVLSYVDTATLTEGATYHYTVRARNGNGNGEWASVVAVLINPDLPSAPRRFQADAQSTGVVMSWLVPVDTGTGGDITGYQIWRWHDDAWSQVHTTNAATLNWTDTASLTVDEWYGYVVRAVNASGGGEWSDVKAVLINPDLPSAPRRFRADAQSTGVVMSWLAPVDEGTGGDITGYNIWRHDGDSWSDVHSTNATTLFWTDTADLIIGKWYWYVVRAVNPSGGGEWSEVKAVLINPDVPSAPRRFRVDAQSSGVVLEWAEPFDTGTGGDITAYNIWRHDGGSWSEVHTTATAVLTWTDTTELDFRTYYWYVVRAVNASGNGEWSEVQRVFINPDVPSAPQRLVVVESTSGIILEWQPPLDAGTGGEVTGYEVWRKSGDAGAWMKIATLGDVLTYTDTDELDGSWHWWAVRAVNAAGPGEWSETSGVTTATNLPGPPGSLTALATTAGVILTWTAPLNDGGSPIIGYKIWRYNGLEWVEIVADTGGDYDGFSVALSTTSGTLSSVTRNGRRWYATLTAPAQTGSVQPMTVTAVVTDTEGETGTATRTWTVDSDTGDGPSIAFTTAADVVEGESVTTITGTVDDDEDDNATLSVNLSTTAGTLSSVTRDGNTWSATLTAPATTDSTQVMTVTATVTDSDGIVGTASRTWMVESEAGNDPVVMFSTGSSTVEGAATITISGTIANAESTDTTYTDTMVAAIGTGIYFYRVQAITDVGIGDFSAAVPVTITVELVSAILGFLIDAGGRPVKVTVGTIVYVGSPATYTVEEETRGVGPYTYRMDNPPPGFVFDPSNRLLSGTATTIVAPFRVYYDAIDAHDDVYPQCFEFHIEDTPLVVTIDGANALEGGLHAEVENYSSRHHGGPDVATVKLVGPVESLASCLNWIRRPIEIHGKEGGILWWGYVNRVQETTGAIQNSASLNQYYTSVAMTHIHEFRPHEIDVNLTQWRQQKPFNQQYGDIELLVNDEAAGLRPLPTVSELDGIVKPFREIASSIEDSRRAPAGVVLNCLGWHRTLANQHVQRYPRGVFGGTRNTDDIIEIGGEGSNPQALWVDYPTNQWAWSGNPYLTGVRFSHKHDAPGLGSKTVTAEVRIARRAAERPGVPPGYTTYVSNGNPDTNDYPEEWLSDWQEVRLTSNPGWARPHKWETYEIDFSGQNIRLPRDGFYFVIRNISGPGLDLSVTTDEAKGLISRHVFDRAQYIWLQDGGWRTEQTGKKFGCDVFLGGDIETVMDVSLDRHTSIRKTATQTGLNRSAPQASFALYREGTDLISSLLESAVRQTDLRYWITPDRKMVIENQPLQPAHTGVRRSIFDDDVTRHTPGVVLVADIPAIETDRRWRFVGDGPLDSVTAPINSPYVTGGPAYLQLLEEEDGGLQLFLSNIPYSRHGSNLGPRFTGSHGYNLALGIRLGDGTVMGWRLGSLFGHNTQPSNSYYHFPGSSLASAGTPHADLLAADVVNNTKRVVFVDVSHDNIDWSNMEIVSDLYGRQAGREDRTFVLNQDGSWQTPVPRGKMDFVGEWVEHDGVQSYCVGANYEVRTGVWDISYRGELSAYEESRDTLGVNVADPRQGPGGA